MKLFIISFLLLVGCAATPNILNQSWIVKDKSNNSCYLLKHKPLFIDRHVTWHDSETEMTFEIENFDIAVVRDQNFQAAAKELNVNLDSCEVH